MWCWWQHQKQQCYCIRCTGKNILTAATVAPPVPVTAAVAPPVPVTAAAGAVGAAPRPLRLGNVVVVATAKTPLLGRLRAASKLAFLFPLLVGKCGVVDVGSKTEE
jgi:hypothetical protein